MPLSRLVLPFGLALCACAATAHDSDSAESSDNALTADCPAVAERAMNDLVEPIAHDEGIAPNDPALVATTTSSPLAGGRTAWVKKLAHGRDRWTASVETVIRGGVCVADNRAYHEDAPAAATTPSRPPPPAVIGCARYPGVQAGSPWPMDGRCPSRSAQAGVDGAQGGNAAARSQRPLPHFTGHAIAIAADGTIYVAGSDLEALRPDGASSKWSFIVGRQLGSPTIGADGTVYVSANHTLYAVTPAGAEKWRYTQLDGDVDSPAIGSDGTIYAGTSTTLYAIRPDGTLRWSTPPSGGLGVKSATLAPDDTIYVSSANRVIAMKPTGTAGWTYQVENGLTDGSPTVAPDGSIIVPVTGTRSGFLSLRPDGTKNWMHVASATGAPAIADDGTIYYGDNDSKVHAIGANGIEKWSLAVSGGAIGLFGRPSIGADGLVYVREGYDENGFDVAIRPDGKLRWSRYAGGTFGKTAIAADGTVFFVGDALVAHGGP